jgi:hypothetical protein
MTGMQIAVKDESETFASDQTIPGHIHWLGKNLDILGVVKWQTNRRIGIEFAKKKDVMEKVQNFLKTEEMVKRLKPLHKVEEGLEIPARLKYWLRADGPCEVFVWQHNDGEIAKSQLLFLETFVEWEDGSGLKTGRVLSKRNVDSPLLTEDEWVFQMDAGLDSEKMDKVKDLIGHISNDLLPSDVRSFLVRQMT